MQHVIAFGDAQRCIIQRCTPLGSETIALADADGRVLAHDVHAPDDLVPFARSAMDGYALCAAETLHANAFIVRSAVYAQATTEHSRHLPRTATPIATGSALPHGTDAVVALEDVRKNDGAIVLERSVRLGQHVFPPGEDARRGERLVARGTLLEPAHLALLASAGSAHVTVARRPRIAIVCTGSELVGIEQQPQHGQIRNSNATIARAIAARAGARIVSEAHVADDEFLLAGALHAAFANADLVVTTGGASVGERDYVKGALRDLGVRFEFDSVAMRPARPAAFGARGTAYVVVLPGNPAAAFVGLHEFVVPALARLQGSRRPCLPVLTARLGGIVHAKPDRTYLPFVRLSAGEHVIATPLENQCSALTKTAVEAHGFARIEPSPRDGCVGDDVTVDVYRWPK